MEHTESKDGTSIAYRRAGHGMPLLLVHGTTADHTRWSAVSPALEQRFTVYAMDRRGRGESGDSPAYDIIREGEDVVAVIEAIGEPVFVLGHSYGGRCSLEAALLTDQIDRLILYEPPIPALPPETPPEVVDRLQSLVDRGDLETALAEFFREIVGMSESELESFRRLPIWAARIPIAPTIPREYTPDRLRPFNPERYAGIETPVMLLVGSDSPPFFRKAIELLRATLPDSQIANLPGQRHVAMDTAPELFVETVLNFLMQEM